MLRVPEQYIGRDAKCSLCLHRFRVPERDHRHGEARQPSAQDPPAAAPGAAPDRKDRRPPRPEADGAGGPRDRATRAEKVEQIKEGPNFTVECPECQVELTVRTDPAGKQWRCPKCGCRFLAPETSEEVIEDVEVVEEEEVIEDLEVIEEEEAPQEEQPSDPDAKPAKRKRRPRRRRMRGPVDPEDYPRLKNGFALLGCTWRVLITDKHLVVFPILSGVLFVLVVVAFIVPLAMLVDSTAYAKQVAANNGRQPLWVWAVGFALGFSLHSVRIFCKVALARCALLRFTGSESSLLAGFGGALVRIPQVLGWALVSATFGLFLSIIEHLHKKIGEVVRAILGAAWGTLTYFVVPVMVERGGNPLSAIGRSVSLLCQTWGTANQSNLGLRTVLKLLLRAWTRSCPSRCTASRSPAGPRRHSTRT
jgi:ribosomal protein L37AE/L43A